LKYFTLNKNTCFIATGDEHKPADVAVRTLTTRWDEGGSLPVQKNFLKNIQDLAFMTNPSMLTKIHGIILSPLSLVMEYFPLSNMRSFLQLHRREISLRTLLDASAQVIKALWWLEDGKYSYGV
jgi:Protein tyrosine and serine/threonine kinase